MMKKRSHILLINPPFNNYSHPYSSIPTLAAYLINHNLSAKGFDLNREFFIRLLSPSHIKHGIEFSFARLQELNSRKQLLFSEMFEYRILTALLSTISNYSNDCTSLYNLEFGELQKHELQKILITIVTMPYFPDIIITEPLFNVLQAHNCFSTEDILSSLDQHNVFTTVYRTIIDELIEKEKPLCVGFSVVFQEQIIPAFQCAYYLKKIAPDIHIVMGGPCISIFFRDIKKKEIFEVVDSMVIDEGELPLQSLLKKFEASDFDFHDVPGLIYLSQEKIISNPPPESLDIRKSPVPDYTIFHLDKYLLPKNSLIVPFRTSKGCFWGKCTFCRTHLPMTRECQKLTPKRACDQLLSIIENTGIRSFVLSDESAPLDTLEYISRQLIKDKIRIRWRAHTRVSKSLTRERAELFRDSGCYNLMLGVESMSDRILALMNKGINKEIIDKVLNTLNGVLPVGLYLIVGFPTETEEEALAGFECVKEYREKGLINMFHYSNFEIHYGSEIWADPVKYSISHIVHPDEDLPGDRLEFTGAGMSRSKCNYYFKKFNNVDILARYFYHTKEIVLNGDRLPLNYDLKEMSNILDWKGNDFFERSLYEWLKKRNKVEPPMSCLKTTEP